VGKSKGSGEAAAVTRAKTATIKRESKPPKNRGHWHKTRQGKAKGSARENANGHALSPRMAFSVNEDDFRRLCWLAKKRNLPVAAVLRDAVWAYLLPIAPDADREERR
jgi:hypothetical protein